MAVFSALRRTPGALLRNPVIVVPVLALGLFQVPQLALRTVNPVLSALASMVLSLAMLVVIPFFQGGLLAMADEALDGRTSLGTFLDAGRTHYVSMLVAYLLVVGVNLALALVLGVLVVVGGLAAYAGAAGSGSGLAGLAVVGAVALVVVLAYLLVVLFVQFYGQAIVLEGHGAIDGLRRSVAVVRSNLASVIGYTLLVFGLGGTLGLVVGLLSILLSPSAAEVLSVPSFSLPVTVAIGATMVVLTVLVGAFFGVYSVAFYRAVVGGENRRG